MSKRDQNREARRRAILEAAKQHFADRGFHATGMADIAAASGVTPANLYRYFPAKEAIVCAIADQQREAVAAVTAAALARPDPLAALDALLVHYLTEAQDRTQSRLWLEILAETARNDRVRAAIALDDEAVKAGFATLIARAAARGDCRPGLDVQATTVFLIALIDGAVGRMAIEPDFDLARATATFLDLIHKALAP
ncbi:TetR/AcrR family transcriptional regulator [Zavarzinia compransoris]|nr:TetR/AcrR family transcriptional regulator [Zavarzinia compransoris]